jgi:hypothetical protein
MRSAREMVLATYDALATTKPHESDYTVGTTAVLIGSTNFQRLGVIVSNTGSVNAAIGFSPNVTITTGLLLLQGGVFVLTWFFDLELVQRPLYAIGASASATLHMVENAITGA